MGLGPLVVQSCNVTADHLVAGRAVDEVRVKKRLVNRLNTASAVIIHDSPRASLQDTYLSIVDGSLSTIRRLGSGRVVVDQKKSGQRHEKQRPLRVMVE